MVLLEKVRVTEYAEVHRVDVGGEGCSGVLVVRISNEYAKWHSKECSVTVALV